MRRSQKLPVASAGGEPELEITGADWERIEGEYGSKLSIDAQRDLLAATEQFLCFEVFERTAEPVADAKEIVEACKKGANTFQRTLLRHSGKSSEASRYAKLLIKRNVCDARLGNTDRMFDTLSGVLSSFQNACNIALKELSSPDLASYNEGESWQIWVRGLAQVMQEAGLPCAARKDAGNKSRSDRESPFVRLVRELQSCLPNECRRHDRSPVALATAVSNALKNKKTSRGAAPAVRGAKP